VLLNRDEVEAARKRAETCEPAEDAQSTEDN
jgi:hypothetical protein